MKTLALASQELLEREGLVLARNIHDPENQRKILFRKGHIFSSDDAEALRRLDGQTIHVLHLDKDDVGEEEAANRVALAAMKTGVEIAGVSEGEVRIKASHRGVFAVDEEALLDFNRQNNVMLWTLQNHVPVNKGEHVASAKIAPLALPKKKVAKAEQAAADISLAVRAYAPRRVGVLVLEEMRPTARKRFETGIGEKIAWFDSPAPAVEYTDEAHGAADCMAELLRNGVELVLVGGTGATDPLDPALEGVAELRGEVIRNGFPAHPGSTYWLAEVERVPVLGIASCGMFSKMTALDLILPRFFAGQSLTPKLISSLALGGLIGKDQAYRFPRYTIGTAKKQGS